MIRRAGDNFILQTPGTAYVFRVMPTGHLEHLYFGKELGWTPDTPEENICSDCLAMTEKRVFEAGNCIAYDPEHKALNLEDIRMEISSRGKGDIRDPFLEIRHADGSVTSDFLFERAEIRAGKTAMETLPSAWAEPEGAEELSVFLRDRELGLELVYSVFSDCDAICRRCRLTNAGGAPVTVERLMSAQLDLDSSGWELSVFHGSWAREMDRKTFPVGTARVLNEAAVGTSSNRSNPFVILHRPDTTESGGACFGLNLIYSGNHCTSAQVNAYRKTRLLTGMNPETFFWLLEPGQSLESPEAVLAYSAEGFRGLSRAMHRFVREHIVRGVWQHKPRPVLLNSWEAAYFDISESKILRLAKAARDAGIELLVMDDGWFAQRSDDTRSLGDWTVNEKKFPVGLSGLARKVRELGLDFGIWVEPEMVNTDSELYRAHPEWTMEIPGRPHSEGRNQRILDLCDPAVTDHLIETFTRLFSSAEISYVKWDMNRIFSDVYSRYLPSERQGEAAHRYVLGLYRVLGALTERFPQILFEGCASGGNRFDLGILCFCPQIWASDNTDALCRVHIQEGYSYGYPMSCISSHVSSSPNHQTLRQTPLMSRFNVAAYGVFGYELNLADLSRSELDEIRNQVALYKLWRDVFQEGDFYRIQHGNVHKWICVSPDRRRAVGMMFQQMVWPNTQYENFRAAGLDRSLRYRFYSLPYKFDIREFGDLVNTVSPVHIRQNSLMHNIIARFVTLPAEVEDITVSGAVLMDAGVMLAPAYGGTGFNDQTRYFQDFGSRLYFMEAE